MIGHWEFCARKLIALAASRIWDMFLMMVPRLLEKDIASTQWHLSLSQLKSENI
jgi:hypothetical protein